MTSDSSNYEMLQEMFLKAVELRSPEERVHYLDNACGEDDELREKIEALLKEYGEKDSETWFQATSESVVSEFDDSFSEKPGTMMGAYKLLEMIGEGGFGAVYVAEQTEPVRRRVALKIIKPGMDSKEIIARFEAERQALALMDDPNIAKVFDAGATEAGRPYFVMELVKGIPITKFCDERQLDIHQRLGIFLDVCSAVQHAHQKGVIHRDIKPANILVTLHGDKPVPKVIDFGIAKATQQQLTDKTMFTRLGQFIGTPVYMSPEQAALSGLDVDTRADIYSLGVLLYELLAGKPPFDSKSLLSAGRDEMRRIIREEDPPKPSVRLSTVAGEERAKMAKAHHAEPDKLGKLVRGDLDWIVMKAMEKDRTRRYATANAVAQDIRRHLNNEPVVAAAPSVAYKIRKFIRRNRSTVAAVAAISILLVAGIATSSWLAIVADGAKGDAIDALAVVESQKAQIEGSLAKAEAAEEASRKLLYATDMQLAPFVWNNQDATGTQLRKLLDAHDPEANEALRKKEDLRGFEWRYYKHLVDNSASVFTGHSTPLIESAFTPDGDLVTLDEHGQVRHWDLESQGEKGSLRRNLPDGRKARQLVLSSNGELAALAGESRVQVLETAFGKKLCTIDSAVARSRRLIFTPAGDMLVVVDDKIRWCGTTDGRIIGSLQLGRRTPYRESITLSADGLTLAVVGHNNSASSTGIGECLSVFRLNPSAGTIVPLLEDVSFDATLSACALSLDRQLIAVGAKMSGVLAVFDLSTGEEIAKHGSAHASPISAIAFSGNGAELATADGEGTIKIWADARALSSERNAKITLKGHEKGITNISFSPDGRKLVSSSTDHTARVWNVEQPHAGIRGVEGQRGRNFMTRFSADGLLFAMAGGDGPVSLRDATTGKIVRELPADHQHGIFSVAFSPTDRSLLAVGHGGSAEASFVSLWDISAGRELARLPGGLGLSGFRLDAPSGVVGALAFSPDGKYLAAGFGHPYYYNPKPEPYPLLVWEIETRRVVQRLDGHMNYCRALEFSRDGALLASASRDGTARIWSTTTWEMTMPPLKNPDRGTRFTQGSDRIEDLAISPDGEVMAMASGGGAVLLWNFKTGKLLEMLEGHAAAVNSVEFSPDGHTLASGSADQTVRLWNVNTRRELMLLDSNNLKLGEIWALAFSPDGRHLLGGGSSTVIWSTTPATGK